VHGAHPPFHVAVIGFDSVIAIAPSSLAAVLRDLSFGLQLPPRGRVTTQAIPDEYMWRPVVRIGQSLFQEQLGSFAIPRLRQVEVYSLALAIDRPKQVHLPAGDLNKGFIYIQVDDLRFTSPCNRR